MAGPTSRIRRRLTTDPATPELRWRAGDARYAADLEPLVASLLAGGDAALVLREKPGRRRLARAALPGGEACFLKLAFASGGATDRWKRRLGRSPGAREFHALRRLRAAQVPAAEALALFESDAGDSVLVTRFLEGQSLADALACPGPRRRELLQAVGAAVAALHRARIAHRDLHRENVWVTAGGPVLIDLQQAVPLLFPALRLRDLGELDASLAPLLSLPDRLRLRAAALGLARPFADEARARLRQVGHASERRLRAHVRSRTARSLREGRLYARFAGEHGSGMRLRSQPEDAVRRAFAAGGDAVQHFRSSPLRLGSPARNAWRAGHGLRARGIGAPRPLAFVEHRTVAAVHSALWLEPAAEVASARPEELVSLGVALRRHAVAIGSDTPLCRTDGGMLGVRGLSAIRFPARLSPVEVQRIDALVEEALRRGASEAERRAALDRYTGRVARYAAETVIQRK